MPFSFIKRGPILVAILWVAGAGLVLGAVQAAPVEHVVIISVDGLRPDAIDVKRMPNLQRLVPRGLRASNAQTVRPSITIAAHVSMLTGLDSSRHKVTGKSFGHGYYRQPTVFSIAKASGLTTAMLFSKKKLDFLANPNYVDFVYGPQRHREIPVDASADAIADAFDEAWSRDKYGLTLIHLREPDKAGHRWGWMSKPYLRAATKTDRAIGRILATLASVEAKAAVLVTADHGGHGRSHQKKRLEIMTIPWILVAPGIPAGVAIDKATHVYDTAPTVLALLGLSVPIDIDGQIIHKLLANAPAPD